MLKLGGIGIRFGIVHLEIGIGHSVIVHFGIGIDHVLNVPNHNVLVLAT